MGTQNFTGGFKHSSQEDEKMKVVKSKRAGFCFGVKRAINMALLAAENANKKLHKSPVFTLGPIVHNSFVVEKLKKEGVQTVNDTSLLKKGCLIIRSHGIPPCIAKIARRKGMKLIDATCPLVKKIHNLVRKLKKEGYKIAIIGHANHPEVKGIAAYAGGNFLIIESLTDAKAAKETPKLGIVVQTTFLLENFKKIASILLEKADEIKLYNTICLETKLRQKMAEKLSKKVDIMIVVGGKNSSNTKRLAEICKKYCKSSHLVENADDLKKDWFKGKKTAGLTAGASTPDWIINEVIKIIKSY